MEFKFLNTDSWQNIHDYDGKYIISLKPTYSIQEKNIMFDNLKRRIKLSENISEEVKGYGIQGINIIQKDIDHPSNFDNFNKVFADDILSEIFVYLINEKDKEIVTTILFNICEQMHCMIITSGTCPVGRCTRLYQIYKFLKEKEN